MPRSLLALATLAVAAGIVCLVASCHEGLPVEPPYVETVTTAQWYAEGGAPPDPWIPPEGLP